MENMNVVYVADENFFEPTLVSMTSVLINCSKKHEIFFHLILKKCNNEMKKKIAILSSKYNCRTKIYNVEDYEQLILNTDDIIDGCKHVTKSTYYRFLIFKILDGVEKCVYIDGDTIINSDIGDIYDDFKNQLSAAVIDIWCMQNRNDVLNHICAWEEYEKFVKEPLKYPYFNAGFILINVKLSMELKIFEECNRIFNEHQNPKFGDQDILNAIFGQIHHEKMCILPMKYNVYRDKDPGNDFFDAYYSVEEIKKSIAEPIVIHFAGPNKPWLFNNSIHYDLWFKYAHLSPMSQDITIKNTKNNQSVISSNTLSSRFKNETVSIVITTFNQENLIKKCINSVINQSYEDIQIIIIDDGSTDNTGKYCDEYAAKDDRIEVVHSINNRGPAYGRNAGIEKIKGKYTLFIDSDDWMEEDMVTYLVNEMNKSDADISICNYYKDYADHVFTPRINYCTLSNTEAFRLLLEDETIKNHVWNKLLKTELIEGIRFHGKHYDDVGTMYKLFLKSKKIVLLEAPKYHHVDNMNGLMNSQSFMERFEVIKIAIERYYDTKEYNLEKEHVDAITNFLLDDFLIETKWDKCIIDTTNENVVFIIDYIINNYETIMKYSDYLQRQFYKKVFKKRKIMMPNIIYKKIYYLSRK